VLALLTVVPQQEGLPVRGGNVIDGGTPRLHEVGEVAGATDGMGNEGQSH